MKDFLKPTKDKLIFTFVIPSYFFFGFSTGEIRAWWLPLPIFLLVGFIIFIMFKGAYDSQINFILQKIQQEQAAEQSAFLMLIELAVPLIFNYLFACLFFHWYYNRKIKS